MPYTAEHPPTPSREELQRRIPGWGADLDHADRPSVPQEIDAKPDSGAWWDYPEAQPGGAQRERSIEHEQLPPVFGTAQPLHGVSGAIRRYAYQRFSEARTAHWLLLVAGDRVEFLGAHVRALLRGRPDDPIAETGVTAEWHANGARSRRGRADNRHAWIDPLLVAAPYLAVAALALVVGRRLFRR